MNPIGQFLNVLFEHLTVNHAEKQTRLLIINGVVINISSVYKAAYSLAIKDGLVVARKIRLFFSRRHSSRNASQYFTDCMMAS